MADAIIILHRFEYIILLIIIAIGIQSCANQQWPEGGPIDPTSPEILSTYPANNTIHFNKNKIRLEFDRYVEERSFEESIFISPYVGPLEFDWSGKEVEVSFSEPLRDNTTYVINIGTDVRDLNRNQKRMAKAYSLAFSTGAEIDRGAIEGRIYSLKEDDVVEGTMIFAYRLDSLNADTLNPKKIKPDFITQTGEDGVFFLYHIPFGSYRVFAVKDEYRNLIYDPEVDEYGMQSSIIRITSEDTLCGRVLMRLAKEDTTGPRLIKATASDCNHIVAEFSEALDSISTMLSSFSVVDTVSGEHLELLTMYPQPTNSTIYSLITRTQDSTKWYRLLIQDVRDPIGNRINLLANSFAFQGSSKSDTLLPKLAEVSIKDSTIGIDLQPTLTLTFSNALTRTKSLDWVKILDNSKQVIPTEKKWISDITVAIKPERNLMSKVWYTLHAEPKGLLNWAGHACRDSTKNWRFETLDLEDMSSVEGTVIDINKSDTSGRIYVQAFQVGEKTILKYTSVADAIGRFNFLQIDEGRYTLQAFRDRNNNDVYDPGKPFPFVLSERLSSFSDTLKVRARWPLEGVLIQIK